ncbi:HAD-IB family hydrolase [Streptomyces roseirectus]|uniref:HAD-IB family hydrolase n=1 Tax=Streptomyces roseirectus TaxID=2768066 RepID=A0A7H0I7T6_9ACTN|nr:HAD-IB family hydrolase [Streptomyces roseirectus]QNP68852.1 HAD-IB family hydrolase [Streptomyces roseirectus]
MTGREKAPLLYRLIRTCFSPLCRVVFRPKVEGLDHVPGTGPAIIAANHLAFCDSLLLAMVVRRPLTFLAKSDYFDRPGLKGRAMAAFFRGTGQLPVDRANARGAVRAIGSAARVLDEGRLLGVYPEGTRSPDGRLYRGRVGAVAMNALTSGAPVVPVGLTGTDRIQPRGTRGIRLARPTVRIGAPMTFTQAVDGSPDRGELERVTRAVMRRIGELSGQEYVDVYASKARSGGGRGSGEDSGSGVAAAFFDLDKTVTLKSCTLALAPAFRRAGLIRRSTMLRAALGQARFLLKGADDQDVERLRAVLSTLFRGWPHDRVGKIVEEHVGTVLAPLIHPRVQALIDEHRTAARPVVLVTACSSVIAEPVGRLIGADHVIAARFVVEDGHYTGAVSDYPYGAAKVPAMAALAAEHGWDLAASYAYSDSHSDLPMLGMVGRPHAVNPDTALRRHALAQGWPVLRLR